LLRLRLGNQFPTANGIDACRFRLCLHRLRANGNPCAGTGKPPKGSLATTHRADWPHHCSGHRHWRGACLRRASALSLARGHAAHPAKEWLVVYRTPPTLPWPLRQWAATLRITPCWFIECPAKPEWWVACVGGVLTTPTTRPQYRPTPTHPLCGLPNPACSFS
jgi:hypothetical protein